MPLETERVKRLVSSARQFSSTELVEAIAQLRKMNEKRSHDEYVESLKAKAKAMKRGDHVICDRNFYGKGLPQIGDSGIVVEVRLCRAPKCAWVLVDWGVNIPKRWMTISTLGAPGSMSQTTIDMNKGLARVMSNL